jgi:hypothetical protein
MIRASPGGWIRPAKSRHLCPKARIAKYRNKNLFIHYGSTSTNSPILQK